MPTHEEELRRIEPVIVWLKRLALLGKTVVVRGREHVPREGPAILIANHPGAFKDVLTLFRIVPRPIFFNANIQIFIEDIPQMFGAQIHPFILCRGVFNPFRVIRMDDFAE